MFTLYVGTLTLGCALGYFLVRLRPGPPEADRPEVKGSSAESLSGAAGPAPGWTRGTALPVATAAFGACGLLVCLCAPPDAGGKSMLLAAFGAVGAVLIICAPPRRRGAA